VSAAAIGRTNLDVVQRVALRAMPPESKGEVTMSEVVAGLRAPPGTRRSSSDDDEGEGVTSPTRPIKGARNPERRSAFATLALAEDAEYVSSLGVALWEVLRVYRPGVRGAYEAFIFVRRVMITAAVVFLSSAPAWRQLTLFLLSVLFLVIHLVVLPYARRWDNVHAGGLLVLLCFICGLETFNTAQYISDPQHGKSLAALVIGIVELALLVAPTCLAAAMTCRTIYRRVPWAGAPCNALRGNRATDRASRPN